MNLPFIKQLRTRKVKQMGNEHAKDPMDRLWKSGIFKEPREGKIWLQKTGLEIDEIADKKVHGGPEKALFAYPSIHYSYWKQDLNIENIGIGAMGENIVIENTDEFTTFIGDTYTYNE